jgi:hypothetical protein
MLLFQMDAADQEDKEVIVYKDYSLKKRIPTSASRAKMTIKQKQE